MHDSSWNPMDVLGPDALLHRSNCDHAPLFAGDGVFGYQTIIERLCIRGLLHVEFHLTFECRNTVEDLGEEVIHETSSVGTFICTVRFGCKRAAAHSLCAAAFPVHQKGTTSLFSYLWRAYGYQNSVLRCQICCVRPRSISVHQND